MNEVKAFMTFDAKNENELKRYLDHHMEYLIDFDIVSDVTTGVHGVISYNPAEKHDRKKLQILAEVISDVLSTEPTDDDLNNDDNAIDLYAKMREMKDLMSNMGLL